MLFFFVLSGTFLWGVVNVLKSHYLRGLEAHEDVATVAVMAGASTCALLVEFLWNGIPQIRPGFWLPFVATALLNVGIQYWNVKSLKIEDASIVTPLAATMPMFMIAMSWVMLREWPTFWGRIGILSIAAGSYLLYLKGKEVTLPVFMGRILPVPWHHTVIFYGAPWLRLFSSKGARLALFTAYLGAVSVNFDKLATLNSSPMLFTGCVFLVVMIFVYGWSKMVGRWDALDKRHFGALFSIGLLMGIVGVLVNAGYLYGIVPYVGTLKRTQIFWTVFFAGIFLQERYTGPRLIGAAVIFVGTIFVAF